MSKKVIENPEWLNNYSKELKEKETIAELCFENYLNELKLKYEKQFPITTKNNKHYVLDFLFPTKKIIVEIDGGYHSLTEQKIKDKDRDIELKKEGYITYRFSNADVIYRNNNIIQFFKNRFKKKLLK